MSGDGLAEGIRLLREAMSGWDAIARPLRLYQARGDGAMRLSASARARSAAVPT